MMTPVACDFHTPATMRALAAAARELGTGVHTHLAWHPYENATMQRRWNRTSAQWWDDFGFFEGPFFGAHFGYPDWEIDAPILRRNDLGRIEEGAQADLTAVDVSGFQIRAGALPPEPLNNLLYASGRSVRHVMTAGLIQVREGKLEVADVQLLMKRGGEVCWCGMSLAAAASAVPALPFQGYWNV